MATSDTVIATATEAGIDARWPVTVIEKNRHDEIHVQRNQYHFANGPDMTGMWFVLARVVEKPSPSGRPGRTRRKGLCLRPEVWRQVIAAVEHELAIIDAEGVPEDAGA